MDTIFLTLQRFNHYSDILRGMLIRSLAENFRVVVITPDLDEKTVAEFAYMRHPNLVYKKIPIRYEAFWTRSELVWRKYFVRSFDDLFVTRHWYYGFIHTKKDRILSALGRMLPKRIMTPELFTRIESALTRVSPEFAALVREYDPKLIVLAAPGWGYMPFTAEMAVFARKLGIPAIAVNCTYDQPFSQAKFIRKTGYIAVINERMKRDMMRLHGYKEENVFITGCLKFDHYINDSKEENLQNKETFLRSKGLDPQKSLVLYATPSPGVYKERMEITEELVRLKKEKKLRGDPNILVRIHPFDLVEPYKKFEGIPGIHIESGGRQRAPDTLLPGLSGAKREMDTEDLKNLTRSLAYADVLVNFASSMTIEAAIFDTPVVNVGFRERHRLFYEYETNRPIREMRVSRFADSLEELSGHINAYLADRSLDREKRAWAVKEYIYFTDGRSYERTCEAIREVIAREARAHTQS